MNQERKRQKWIHYAGANCNVTERLTRYGERRRYLLTLCNKWIREHSYHRYSMREMRVTCPKCKAKLARRKG